MNQEVKFHKPTTIDSATKILLEAENPVIVAGGTDFVVKLRNNMFPTVTDFVDILALGLDKIGVTDDKVIIGSGCKMTEIAENEELVKLFPVLTKAASTVGALQIRNLATIGGNIANASPAGDTIPALLSLEADVNIQGVDSKRKIALTDLFVGRPGKTSLKKGEIIVSFEISKRNTRGAFEKLGERKAHAISKINLALTIWDKEPEHKHCRIAMGSVAPVVLRCPHAEAYVEKEKWPLSDEAIEKVASLVEEVAKPIDDIRSTATYRKKMASELFKRAIKNLSL